MEQLICPLCNKRHSTGRRAGVVCEEDAIARIAILERDASRWRKLCMQAEAELAKRDARANARKGCDHVRRVGWGGRWLCTGCGADLGPCVAPRSRLFPIPEEEGPWPTHSDQAAAFTGSDRIADPHHVTQPAKEPSR